MTTQDNSPIDLGIPGITDAVKVGSGGFGVVYRAVEAELGRPVAIKLLSGNLNEADRLRFDRERRAMGTLSDHPNIVTVYRSGFVESGNAYMAMEYLPHGSLSDRLESQGALPWEEVVKFGVQLSGALEMSHRAGVLHRDIKPANVLLSRLGNAKLCDFGIARLHGAPETQSRVITASVAHAPPEIMNGQRPTEMADVYSLASTMYELVTGSPPFVRPDDESIMPILSRIQQDPVPPLPPDQLPAPVAEVLHRAMSKDPDERPASALAFGELLVACQEQLGVTPTPLPIERSIAVDPTGDTPPAHIPPFPVSDSGPLPPPVVPDHEPTVAPTGEQPPAPTGPDPAAYQPDPVTPPTTVRPSNRGSTADATQVAAGLAEAGPVVDADAPAPAVTGQGPAPTPAAPPAPPAVPTPPARPGSAAPEPVPPVPAADPQPAAEPPSASDAAVPATTGAPPTPSLPASTADGIGRLPVIAGAAVVAAAVIGVVAWLGLRGPSDETAPAATTEPAAPTTETTADAAPSTTPETVPGAGDGDYAFYRRQTDATGAVSVLVPDEWTDIERGPGANGSPFLAAAPTLEGAFFDSFTGPGLSVSVEDGAVFDMGERLDAMALDECTSDGREEVFAPYRGMVEAFVNCDGAETLLTHVVLVEGGRTIEVRIQMVDGRDVTAASTAIESLTLDG
ncbi:MAG: protein kinase [Actinomycetota bacterium]